VGFDALQFASYVVRFGRNFLPPSSACNSGHTFTLKLKGKYPLKHPYVETSKNYIRDDRNLKRVFFLTYLVQSFVHSRELMDEINNFDYWFGHSCSSRVYYTQHFDKWMVLGLHIDKVQNDIIMVVMLRGLFPLLEQ
jgi:hypothetical protein